MGWSRLCQDSSELSPQGFLECSYLFYGYYQVGEEDRAWYIIRLAYLLNSLGYLLLCFLWILHRCVPLEAGREAAGCCPAPGPRRARSGRRHAQWHGCFLLQGLDKVEGGRGLMGTVAWAGCGVPHG